MMQLVLALLIALLPVSLAAQSILLDPAYDAYDAGDNAQALALAQSVIEGDPDFRIAVDARELLLLVQFEEGRGGQAFLDELLALDTDMATVYGADALERLNTLSIMSAVAYDLGSDDSLRADVQIVRIARQSPDTTDDMLLALRNIAVEQSNGSDVLASAQFAALYELMAEGHLPDDDPTVMEARVMLAVELMRLGDTVRGLEKFASYPVEDWESYAQTGPSEAELVDDMFAGVEAAFADETVDWQEKATLAFERSATLAALAADIDGFISAGDLQAALPLMEQYLQQTTVEDPAVPFYASTLMGEYLKSGQFVRARPYLATTLSYPSALLAALDVPIAELALNAARSGGVEDSLLETLLLKGLEVEQILRDPDPEKRIDLLTLVGQTKARTGDYDGALLAYENAVMALEASGHDDDSTRKNALFGAGLALMDLGQEDAARPYFEAFANVAEATDDIDALSTALTQLALIEIRLNRPTPAIAAARRLLELEEARDVLDAEAIGMSKTVLAMALFTQSPRLTPELSDVLAGMFEADVRNPTLRTSRQTFFSIIATRSEMSAADLAKDETFNSFDDARKAEVLTVLAKLAMEADDLTQAEGYMRFGLDTAASLSVEISALRLIEGQLAHRAGRAGDALMAYRAVTDAQIPPGVRPQPSALAQLPYHLSAAFDLATDPAAGQDLRFHNEMFQIAQLASATVAGGSLNDALLRSQAGGAVQDLLREQQVLAREYAVLQQAVSRAQYDGRTPKAILARVNEVEDRQSAITAQIAKAAPELASFSGFEPLRMEAVAQRLREDEAMIIFASSDVPAMKGQAASYAIALSHDSVLVTQIPARADILGLARRLRCSAALTDPNCAGSGAGGTRGSFDLDPQDGDEMAGPAFDTDTAHDAYLVLFAALEELTNNKSRLVIVADPALISMPFHLALKAPLDPAAPMRDGAWLIRDHSIEITPSVASFVALRDASSDRATRQASPRADRFLGIGDPLIGIQQDGPMAFECGDIPKPFLTAALDTSSINRGLGTTRTNAVRDLAALPDTRCELRRLAAHFGTDSKVMLNADASESAIKSLSASGALRDYSVISFATHGLVAGEIGINDSGLVLSPPVLPTALDDGLLTTHEIAALDLDADFVILSACNTASGDSQNQEGLSGMASAFFFAGARSLMVSHWPVYSDAAVDFTTRSFDALQSDNTITRADAVRIAMLAILDDPFATARQSHPSYWAPFTIVGDGLSTGS